MRQIALPLMFLGGIYAWANCTPACAGETRGGEPSFKSQGPDHWDIIQSFAKRILNRQVALAGRAWDDSPSRGMPYVTTSIEVKDTESDLSYRIALRKDDGVIFFVHRKPPFDEPPRQDMKAKDGIDEKTAFETVSKLLAYYQIDIPREEFQPRLLQHMTPIGLVTPGQRAQLDGNLRGCVWEFRADNLKYQGVPCRFASFNCEVDASSGALLLLGYKPVLAPAVPKQAITREEAVKSASEWVLKLEILGATSIHLDPNSQRVEKVIAYPINFFGSCRGRDFHLDGPLLSRYCWEVPFTHSEHEYNFEDRAWVDVETGQCIGGD